MCPRHGGKPADDRPSERARVATVRSVTRAMRLLSVVIRSPDPVPLVDLSRETGLHKSSALRLLRTLIGEGLVTQDPGTGRYQRSPVFWIRLMPSLRPAMSLVRDAQAEMDRIARESNATALIGIVDVMQRHIAVVVQAVPSGAVSVNPAARPVVPLHVVTAGKCYLAHASEAELARYLATPLVRMTSHTIVSEAALSADLGRIRQRGYAVTQGELDPEAVGLGVPLRGPREEVVGGVSLALASPSADGIAIEENLQLLREAADTLSGYLSLSGWRARLDRPGWETQPSSISRDPGFGEEATPAVRSVARAVRLLELLGCSHESLRVTDIADARGLSRGTAARLLRTLEAERLVVREADAARYAIDPVLFLRLAPLLGSGALHVAGSERALEQLAEATGATALILSPDVDERMAAVTQHALPKNRPSRFNPEAQPAFPLHASAGGKCCLAALPKRRLATYVRGGLSGCTPSTITSPERLRRELEAVRRQGYAVDREEAIPGVAGLAVPLRAGTDEVVAALSIAPLVRDLSRPNIRAWLPKLRAAARALSDRLLLDWRRPVSGDDRDVEGR